MEDLNFRPAYLEVNIDSVINNAKLIKNYIGDNVKYCAVVKGNMYGLGIRGLIKYIDQYADMYAVAILSEAIELRKLGVTKDILILGYTPDYLFETLVEYDIIPATFYLEDAKKLNEIAKKHNKTQKVHIKVDTGMVRIGYVPNEESKKEIEEISKLSNIIIDGIFTHFTSADEKDSPITDNQYRIFKEFTDDLENRGINLGTIHCTNSAGTSDYKKYHEDMVRVGYYLSGMWTDSLDRCKFPFKAAAQMKAKIVRIREVEKGTDIGYNHSTTTTRRTRVATLPIGYTDGLPRGLRDGYVSVNGKKAKVLGSVCMDQMMIDVTDIDCDVMDTAIIYGYEEGAPLINDLVKLCNTNNIDILSKTNKRVPRVYIRDGEIVEVIDELLSSY